MLEKKISLESIADEKKIRKLFVPGSETNQNRGWADAEINFDDQEITCVCFATFLIYEESRNTWGGVFRNKNFNSYHYDLDTIKYRIKVNRKPGSRFKVSTEPAIALMGKTESIIITDYYEENSSRAKNLSLKSSFSSNLIYEIAQEILGSYSYNSSFTVSNDEIPKFFFPGYKYVSIKGSDSNLLINPVRKEADLKSLFQLGEIINNLILKS